MGVTGSAVLRRGVIPAALAAVAAGNGFALANAHPSVTAAHPAAPAVHRIVHGAVVRHTVTRHAVAAHHPSVPSVAVPSFAAVPELPPVGAAATTINAPAALPATSAAGSGSAAPATGPTGYDPCLDGGLTGPTVAQQLYTGGLSAVPLVQQPLAAGPVSRVVEFEGQGNAGATEVACAVSLVDQNADGIP